MRCSRVRKTSHFLNAVANVVPNRVPSIVRLCQVPIRFARRVLELRNLPYGLSDTAPVIEAAGCEFRVEAVFFV